jgi:predicted DNA-binding transcriptional regulator AlpA
MDRTMDAHSRAVTDVNGFCREHGISRAHFYNLIKRGHGPTVLRAGRRTLISLEAAAEWRRRMEGLAATLSTRGSERP